MNPEENIAVLKKRRATIQASCTRIKTFVNSVASAPITSSVVAQFEERRIKLESYWSEYDTVQTKIESQDEKESDHRAGFEEAFYSLSAQMRELLNFTSAQRHTTVSHPTTSRASDSLEASHIRLPRLNLPTFSGNYDEWFPFFDSFQAIIHSNPSLDDIQKFQYLRASLTGASKSVIDALEISAANYQVAWSLLKERYDNKRLIVQRHIKAIMELPSMTKENAIELRQIADGAARHMHALQALKRPTSHWDDLIVHVLSGKLDTCTMREWQNSLTTNELPTLKQFFDFITHRCQMLESTSKSNALPDRNVNLRHQANTKRQTACVATCKVKCNYCREEHSIYYCKDFLDLPIPQRIAAIRKVKLCINCLRSTTHTAIKCTAGNCRLCKLKHNTLLHFSDAASHSRGVVESEAASTSAPTAVVTHSANLQESKSVLLSTAIVHAYGEEGSRKSCRVLLDCGSQANFISRKFLKSLGIKASAMNVSISGISNTTTTASQIARVRLQSRTSSFSSTINCIVTDQVTERLPAFTLKRSNFELPRNLKLADPRFHVSSDVDILIGAELFWQLLCIGRINATPSHPTLQKTQFGWILAGCFGQSAATAQHVQSFHVSVHASISNSQLHEQLARFWSVEEIQNSSNYTSDESRCEQHFLDNVRRSQQGRYIVKLPFKEEMVHKIGDSRQIALKRLHGLERRFKRDPSLKARYSQFLNEYLALGHMKLVEETSQDSQASFYLPHHCVFKDNSISSKFRVVFDASCKSSSGLSLNDALMIGPVVQQDLTSILLRFRTFLYVIAADIIKMYRQVNVDPSQTRYQRILWRDDITSNINAYELTTVTYGTSSASYLATRCLKHLAELFHNKYPVGSLRVQRDFYVDDLLTGANTAIELKETRDQIISLLQEGSFELSKWASNCPSLTEPLQNQSKNAITISNGTDSSVLGVQWNHSLDAFYFLYNPSDSHDIVSKRTVISEVSKLFDPLGLLGPVVVLAKLIIQELWQLDSHWDESVPPNIYLRWTRLKAQLSELNQLMIPRCVKFSVEPRLIQLHGFCDASQRAYGACVYIRTQLSDNEYRSELLCAKSRVAPIKAVSLPRLELAAALLLAQLVSKITTAVDLAQVQIYLWSDSTITLNWISSPSRKWAVFVANRVGEIQRLTKPSSWRHISSANNPADLLSRGLEPHELVRSSAWWHGPEFLSTSEPSWPSSDFAHLENVPELKGLSVGLNVMNPSMIEELIGKYSNLEKLCRILAYCLRLSRAHRSRSFTVFVSHSEILFVMNLISKDVQMRLFPDEYKALINGHSISTLSKLLSLTPFMTPDGLIRVGGRLQNSNLSFETRHPILLPRGHEFAKRVIQYEHSRNGHAGVQATMAAVRQRFWPLSLRSTTRKVIQNCIICFKAKPSQSEAIMGSLPAGRVTVSRPFYHCGVDYAGPLILRECKRRNARTSKAYVAIFVCFATRAIHIELVSDLTSDAFIGALKRFVSRRGKPAHVYSDNGTTFVGTQRQLKEFYEALCDDPIQTKIKNYLRDQNTHWSFIPPNAPHFGGLWEAAVKSAKYHLCRIVGKAHLTFEEMQTVLCEIEAILNSRPIVSLSEDPNDLSSLSPGHFLVGTSLNSFPYGDISDVNENRLVRWQRVEQLRQHFWRRWSEEYLHSLQQRNKWKTNKGQQLKLNQLVLLKQQNLAPLQWVMGRVVQIHEGADGNVRAATVKTAAGSLMRPLSKIAILPINC